MLTTMRLFLVLFFALAGGFVHGQGLLGEADSLNLFQPHESPNLHLGENRPYSLQEYDWSYGQPYIESRWQQGAISVYYYQNWYENDWTPIDPVIIPAARPLRFNLGFQPGRSRRAGGKGFGNITPTVGWSLPQTKVILGYPNQ